MADEYISKQAFNDAIREAVRKYPNTFYNGLEVSRQIAHDMDAADVAPVRHGEWRLQKIPFKGGHGQTLTKYKCSACKGYNRASTPYCPNCGAKMDGE